MADSQDVELLQSGEKDLQRCDLSGCLLSGQSLVGIDFRGCKLKSANFSGCYLERCDFREAELVGADFSNSRIVECHFSHVVFQVNFDGVSFVGGAFKALSTRSTFRGSRFEKVDVNGLRFGDDTVLDGASSDDATDFDGVPMSRTLSRLPIFKNYKFERGRLVRSVGERNVNEITPDQKYELGTSEESIKAVGRVLSSNRDGALLMCRSLSISISEFVVQLSTPNEPDRLEFHLKYVNILQQVMAHVDQIACSLEGSEGIAGVAGIEAASASVLSLRGVLQDWWNENGSKAVNFGANIGLLGAGTAFLTFCGAPPTMAAGISALLGGSRAVIDYVVGKQQEK